MERVKKKQWIRIVILVVIMILQVLAICYATSKRVDLHIDEYYSLSLIQKKGFIFEEEDFLNNWHTPQYFEDFMTISKQERSDFLPVYTNQIKDVHPPIYYLLLRIAYQFAGAEFSIWPGIIVNIILALASTLLLFEIGKKVMKDEGLAIILCAINAFSLAAIDMAVYLRMYQLLTLEVMLLFLWHLQYQNKESRSKKAMFSLALVILIGVLTHYYFLFALVGFGGCYFIQCFSKRKWKNFFKYAIIIVCSVGIAVLIFPAMLEHIFFGYRGEEAIQNFFGFQMFNIRITSFLQLINRHLFFYQLTIFFIIFIIGLLVTILKRYKKTIVIKKEKLELLIAFFPVGVLVAFPTLIAPYKELRYIMYAIPLLYLALIVTMQISFKQILKKSYLWLMAGILSFVIIGHSVTQYSNNLFTFPEKKELFHEIEQKHSEKSCILVYRQEPTSDDRMVESMGIVRRVKETYIIARKELSTQKIKEVLQGRDTSNGIIVYLDCSKNISKEEIQNTLSFFLQDNLFHKIEEKEKIDSGRVFVLK